MDKKIVFGGGLQTEEQKMVSYIMFNVIDFDGEEYTLSLRFSCARDLEVVFGLYAQKDWETLFIWDGKRSYEKGSIASVMVGGILIEASNEDGTLRFVADDNLFASAEVTLKSDLIGD